mmetsp:Transcript_13763/g.22375  ORF Transcript_13763/g.22375 Transcript_13763/m.22375 type:complete len:269 (+) Transcript_13763:1652-2458(+)
MASWRRTLTHSSRMPTTLLLLHTMRACVNSSLSSRTVARWSRSPHSSASPLRLSWIPSLRPHPVTSAVSSPTMTSCPISSMLAVSSSSFVTPESSRRLRSAVVDSPSVSHMLCLHAVTLASTLDTTTRTKTTLKSWSARFSLPRSRTSAMFASVVVLCSTVLLNTSCSSSCATWLLRPSSPSSRPLSVDTLLASLSAAALLPRRRSKTLLMLAMTLTCLTLPLQMSSPPLVISDRSSRTASPVTSVVRWHTVRALPSGRLLRFASRSS